MAVAMRTCRSEAQFAETCGRFGIGVAVRDGDYVFTHFHNPGRWGVGGYRLGRNYTREHIMGKLADNDRAFGERLSRLRESVSRHVLEDLFEGMELVAVVEHGTRVRDVARALAANERYGVRRAGDYARLMSAARIRMSATRDPGLRASLEGRELEFARGLAESGGLVLYYRHYAPTRPDMGAAGAAPDPRGMPAVLWNDSFVVAVPPGEMELVDQVYYEGQLVLFRLEAGGGLADMRKVDRAHMLLVPGKGSENARLRIAEALAAVRAARAECAGSAISEDVLERAACEELGVPVPVARECLDFQLAYALADAAYARRNGLPCLDGDGVPADASGLAAAPVVSHGYEEPTNLDGPGPGLDFSS